MSNVWFPKNFEEACKRNAGRRKLHIRKRKERASRILGLLTAMEATPQLRESAYGCLSRIAESMNKSKSTASRDLALCRRIHSQFLRMFGRTFEAKKDQVKWSWNWSHYGFRTRESVQAGHKKPVGRFPFDTRAKVTEEAFCGFGPSSWRAKRSDNTSSSTGDLLSIFRLLNRYG